MLHFFVSPYRLTKPIRGSSQWLGIIYPENRNINLSLFPNKEMYQTLLSLGQDLQVLESKVVVEEF